jgi:hypothetical protein
MITEDTRRLVLEASAWSLVQHQGRMHDYGDPERPWLFILCGTMEEGAEIREALGYVGFVKRRRDGLGWKYGAYGNDALVVLDELVPFMKGYPRVRALGLLDKWGKEGGPYSTEYERVRADRQRRSKSIEQ